MSKTTASLGKKIDKAKDLQTVVRIMKTVAASSINQYEKSVSALTYYYRTVELGLSAFFQENRAESTISAGKYKKTKGPAGAIVFGSDQGLVGKFNNEVADFIVESLSVQSVKTNIWAVGERVYACLDLDELTLTGQFPVPNSVKAIAPLVEQILIECEKCLSNGDISELYLFYNSPKSGALYTPFKKRLLPLDKSWKRDLIKLSWPNKNLPEVVGSKKTTLNALIREYLFVSIFRACAESLASENASRLAAMQRSEKNITELLEELTSTFHRLRQSDIDEELFDVISGFEALNDRVT